MEIQPVAQAGSLQGSEASLSTGTVTQDEFLTLLIVQLQNQNPLDPIDNQEFLAQLATFNSLNQLIGINGKLDAMKSDQLLLSRLETTSLIGKQVTAEGNSVTLSEEAGADIYYSLAANAVRVVVHLSDSQGELVRTLEVGGQSAGEQSVVWDGKDTFGKELSSGVYGFEVNAFDLSGQKVDITRRIQGVVTGVNLMGATAVLEVGDLNVPVSTITRVLDTPDSKDPTDPTD